MLKGGGVNLFHAAKIGGFSMRWQTFIQDSDWVVATSTAICDNR